MALGRIGYTDMTIPDLIVIFSGILMIVGFIFSWITVTTTLVSPGTIELTGISLMTNSMTGFEGFGGFIPLNLIPIVVAILGVILLIIGFIPFKGVKSTGLSLFGAAVAVIAIILIAIFILIGPTPDIFADSSFRLTIEDAISDGTFGMRISVGPVFAAVGAVIAMLACLVSAKDQSY